MKEKSSSTSAAEGLRLRPFSYNIVTVAAGGRGESYGRYGYYIIAKSDARGAAAQTFGSRGFQAERLLSVKGSVAELGTFGDERESLGTCGALNVRQVPCVKHRIFL